MNKPSYPFNVKNNGKYFEFESVSVNKKISKIIEFSELEVPNIFNLALVEVTEDGIYTDLVVSNNRDMETIISTVIKAIEIFFTFHESAQVLIMGSSSSRTRLYRGVVNKYLAQAELITMYML